MSNVPMRDILIAAKQESQRMRHYYLGVEHLFIALLEVKSGLMSMILTEEGLSTDYVINSIRRKLGKGGRQRLFVGTPNTRRTDLVMTIAQEIALEHQRNNIFERDLLLAILDEGNNMPLHVLRALGLDLEVVRHKAATLIVTRAITQTFVQIELGGDVGSLSQDALFILRKMFHGYGHLFVQTRLTGGYSSATLLVVNPTNIDGRADAPLVVKIGNSNSILDEAHRYEKYVRRTLPPLNARLEDKPTAPDTSDYAGVKYTLLTDNNGNARDLRTASQDWSGQKLGNWLQKQLFLIFAKNWWGQSRPYTFEAWKEYDWVLPPMLTLELEPKAAKDPDVTRLKAPLKQEKLHRLEYGDAVNVENFTVHKVNHESQSIQLALTHGNNTTRAYQIEIRGVNFDHDTYYAGEIVDRISGRVWRTRNEQLTIALRALNPDFNVTGNFISVNHIQLPNPLTTYRRLLMEPIRGSMCTIHGDLHLGNILIGSSDNALLIDFAHTREGHTLFDWATLEISILAERIVPLVDDTWDALRQLLGYIITINRSDAFADIPVELIEELEVIRALRRIVKECLAVPEQWGEYYAALALVSLRAMTWETMSLASRRFMYIVSALAMYEFKYRHPSERRKASPNEHETDDINSTDL